jgi:pyruvate dehydrogenase E2 component (dihydrolipoamide acetyltransferase)
MKELKFVDVGEGITEGQIREWLVKDLEMVREDQPVVKVETDKAIVDAPAPISGIIKINVSSGSKVNVGDTIAYIGTKEEIGALGKGVSTHAENDVSKEKTAKPTDKEENTNATAKPEDVKTENTHTTVTNATQHILATPSVRKLARELNIDLSKIHGTGPNGRITEEDLNFETGKKPSGETTMPQKASPAGIPNTNTEDRIERIQMSMTRKAIAKNMELSWTIPRATHMEMVNTTRLFSIVENSKADMQSKGVKLTFMPFIIKAIVEALKDSPGFNASYDKERSEIIIKKYYNIGLAAEGPDGLKVVVIKDADKKPIIKIAEEIQALGQKVRNRTVSIDEMRDSTITLTNIGSLGGGYLAVPMINYPEVAIIGAMRMKEMPAVEDGRIVIQRIMPMSVTFDHRVVDGADAVVFMNAIKKYLEDPDFLEML